MEKRNSLITFRTTESNLDKMKVLMDETGFNQSYLTHIIINEVLKDKNIKYLQNIIIANVKIPGFMKEEIIPEIVGLLPVHCPQCGKYKGDHKHICQECREENKEANIKMQDLIDKGHTGHCANRQVYGDGECECGVL